VEIESFKNKKIALVLSGGVIKAGAWHMGVALALEDLGLNFKSNTSTNEEGPLISTYVGSSAGSFVNVYLAAGLRPHEVIESFINRKNTIIKPLTYKDLVSFKRPKKISPPKGFDPMRESPLLIRTLLRPFLKISGLFTTEGLCNYLKENVILSNDYEDYKADLFTVATHLDHSKKVIFGKYKYPVPGHDSTAVYETGFPLAETVAASMSVPFIYSPYPLKDQNTGKTEYYIDGEIRETLSTHVARDNGCDVIISSWTHTPYHFQEEIGSLVNYGIPTISLQAIHLMIEKKIVAARSKRKMAKDVVDTLNHFLKDHKFDDKLRKKIVGTIERKMNYKPNVKYINIFPKPENYKIFFKNSFSLNPEHATEIVSAGYKKTMEVFKNL
jgi:predicted acylesterase/phospholipase RssA